MSNNKPIYKLRDWINEEKLNWKYLSQEPRAVYLFEKHIDKIDWQKLQQCNHNPEIISLLEKYPNKIHSYYFSSNPNAISWLDRNPNNIDWWELTKNPNIYGVFYLFTKYSELHNTKDEYSQIRWSKLLSDAVRYDGIVLFKKFRLIFNFNHFSIDPINLSVFPINTLEQNINNINFNTMMWYKLCEDPKAINILEKFINKFTDYYWQHLCKNPSAIHILKNNIHKLDTCEHWSNLCQNSEAIDILIDNITKIIKFNCVGSLVSNPNAIKILKIIHFKLNEYNWAYLCATGNSEAICLLEEHPDKINWDSLSRNPNAIHILKENLDKINWKEFCYYNPNIVSILEKYPEKINWNDKHGIINNINLFPLLEKNIDKVNWKLIYCSNCKEIREDHRIIDLIEYYVKKSEYAVLNRNTYLLNLIDKMIIWEDLSMNPNIFKLDYEAMAEKFEPLSRELNDYLCDRPHLLTIVYEN